MSGARAALVGETIGRYRSRPTVSLGSPRVRLAGGASRLRLDHGDDVSPDGRLPSFVVVEGWFTEMRQ